MRALALVLALSALAVDAAEPTAPDAVPTHGTWSVVFENDLFRETDRDYTGGIALVWLPREKPPPGWLKAAARALPWFPEHDALRHVYAVGQNAFTPRDIQATTPPPDDRPYAGWLWAMAGIGARTGDRIDQFALTIGVVGPWALAEETQSAIHSVTGSDQPRGWDTQLANELGLVAFYQRSWRDIESARAQPGRVALEITPHVGGALGNVYTYGSAGLTLRVGRGLDHDLGPPRIQPALPGSGLFIPAPHTTWYFFLGLEGRAVARNIFLDGNTFDDGPRVEREPLVGDVQWGFAVALDALRLSYTGVIRTVEFTTQRSHDEFGVLTVSRAF